MLELRTRLDCLERRVEVQLQQLTDLQDRHRRLADSVRLLEREVVTDQPGAQPAAPPPAPPWWGDGWKRSPRHEPHLSQAIAAELDPLTTPPVA